MPVDSEKPTSYGLRAKRALRSMVERSGKTASDVSRALGRSRNYIYVLLRERTVPNVGLFLAIAAACGYEVVARGPDGHEISLTDPQDDH